MIGIIVKMESIITVALCSGFLAACYAPRPTSALASSGVSHSRQEDCAIHFATQKVIEKLSRKISYYINRELALQSELERKKEPSSINPCMYLLRYTQLEYSSETANELVKSALRMTHSDVQDASLELARDVYQDNADDATAFGYNEYTHVRERFHSRPKGEYGDPDVHHNKISHHYHAVCDE